MAAPVASPSAQVAPALTRSECLAALAQINQQVEPTLRRAWHECAGPCLAGLRGLLAPFDYGALEVRVKVGKEWTLLDVRVRDASRWACGDPVALDVLQEVDQFLQAHREWAVHLDGALLYP